MVPCKRWGGVFINRSDKMECDPLFPTGEFISRLAQIPSSIGVTMQRWNESGLYVVESPSQKYAIL